VSGARFLALAFRGIWYNEIILNKSFMNFSQYTNKGIKEIFEALKAFIAWGIPCPAHALFALALACVALCAWVTLRIARGAKKL